MSRSALYTKRLDLCLTEEQKKKIEKIAKRKELTVNQVIRNMIDDYDS